MLVLRYCATSQRLTKFIRNFAIKQYFSSGSTQHSSNTESITHADIVISGGGLVGTALACALGQNKVFERHKVVLLESQDQRRLPSADAPYSNRVCALSLATINFLTRLGCWDRITAVRAHPVRQMQVWDSCSNSQIVLSPPALGAMAYIVENDLILGSLSETLNSYKNIVTVKYNSKALQYQYTDDAQSPIAVTLQSGETLITKFLVGADGWNSEIRSFANFDTLKWNYHQSAIVATLKITETENTVAWQRFLPTGPIAFLPLNNSTVSLVWSVKKDHAVNLLSMDEEKFIDAVNDAVWHERHQNSLAVKIFSAYNTFLETMSSQQNFGRQLPPTVLSVMNESRAAFPLGFSHSSQYVKNRIALIGDAAHRVHPLAGQGVNLGFGDVNDLTDILAETVYNGEDIGDLSYLRAYETSRQRRNVPVSLVIDTLHRLFSTHITPVVLLRGVGLQTVNAFPYIKNRIISQATHC